MLSEYFKGYIDALCYPIYRGARKAGCLQIPLDQVEDAKKRINRLGCLCVMGKTIGAEQEIWIVSGSTAEKELLGLFNLEDQDKQAYHKEIGRLLGYSEQHIRIFLETERPTV
jgi:hypothetical protein